jgi:hypothetical protein
MNKIIAAELSEILKAVNYNGREIKTPYHIEGDCNLTHLKNVLLSLPDSLRVDGVLMLSYCDRLQTIPKYLNVGSLYINDCPLIEKLPVCLQVRETLQAYRCSNLRSIEARLNLTGDAIFTYCYRLDYIAKYLNVAGSLDISYTAFKRLPERCKIGKSVIVTGCNELILTY